MRIRVLSMVAAGLLLAGCGGSPQQEADAPDTTQAPASSSAPPSGKSAQGPDGEEPAGTGSMIVTYQDATSPEAIAGRDVLQADQVLEEMADDINQTLNLPYDIPLLGVQCDQANAFWDPNAKTISICYEDTSNSERIFTEAGDPDPVAGAINAEWATFYHEVGHMAITVYDLPVTGREEDVADQLAAYILLTPGDDGQIDPESVQAVKDFARVFNSSGEGDTEVSEQEMADVHSLDLQRVYNLECWIYGSDPGANGDLVADGQLPEDRAAGCQDEWQQLDQAWSTLLDPYFK
ncbi:DUF4344 domain-containing metallopeptidase [Mycolicibacterium sp. CR10]|uniref:DUF4344 domain-containing metallopeptidase n=1 Tax=Mycolicibacterium sp. CR10 TaxID=2562314 RepID=UPI0010C1045E|nr:DUF4344 domain-containing metallopeptidase [Mycolicibacterium sp. CR10]